MNPISIAALEVERVCRAARFSFCFIGGIAVQRWGKPRMTADVDLTVVTGFGGEEPYVDALLAELTPLLQLREDSTSEARLRKLLAKR